MSSGCYTCCECRVHATLLFSLMLRSFPNSACLHWGILTVLDRWLWLLPGSVHGGCRSFLLLLQYLVTPTSHSLHQMVSCELKWKTLWILHIFVTDAGERYFSEGGGKRWLFAAFAIWCSRCVCVCFFFFFFRFLRILQDFRRFPKLF